MILHFQAERELRRALLTPRSRRCWVALVALPNNVTSCACQVTMAAALLAARGGAVLLQSIAAGRIKFAPCGRVPRFARSLRRCVLPRPLGGRTASQRLPRGQ